jgi:hypothetical protein
VLQFVIAWILDLVTYGWRTVQALWNAAWIHVFCACFLVRRSSILSALLAFEHTFGLLALGFPRYLLFSHRPLSLSLFNRNRFRDSGDFYAM